MKGLIRGAAGLAALLVLSACAKDETIDLMGSATGVQANPISAFTSKGDSVAILVRLVNDRNQAVPAKFDVSNVGPALTVAYDKDYRPDYTQGDTLIAPEVKPQQRYFAKGAANGKSTFTISSGGFSTTVTVVVQPKTLENALSKTAGLTWGDTITITAPAGLKFTAASTVTFATGPSSIASLAADGSSLQVVLGPGTGGVATITGVVLNYAPTLAARTLVTTNAVEKTPVLTLGDGLSATTGLVAGQAITLTAPAGLVFSQTSAVTFPTGAIAIGTRSADSTSIQIFVGPGTSGPATVTKVGIVKAPNVGVFTVATTNAITALPSLTVVPTTVSTTTPAFGASMTVTIGGGLKFTPTSTVTVGGRAGYVLSRSADSSTATIVPFGGSTGVVAFTNVALPFTGGSFTFALPGDKNVTVGPVVSIAGATAEATAPLLTLPAVGETVVLSDGVPYVGGGDCDNAGADGCRYYKIVLAAPMKVDFELKWDPGTTADMGLYLNSGALVADAGGNTAGGTETKLNYTLPAGTYYLMNVWYNYAPGTGMPPFFHLKITGKP